MYYYNRKYGRDGHLFKERFKSEPVNDMAYFTVLLRYIHQNPVKAGIVEKEKRNEIIVSCLEIGTGLRQLSRLTGVTYGVINKLNKGR